ncbi:unknown [Clostridium sp. CAG:510]|nr:unknown [Clostridium sp. CAG:510]
MNKEDKLEVKKIDKKIEMDTTTEGCKACMHFHLVMYYGSTPAYSADLSSCHGVTYDRQGMPFWLG